MTRELIPKAKKIENAMACAPEKEEMNIFWAAFCGDIEVVNRLLDRGADIEHQDDYGNTLLMLACRYGHTKLINFLLDKGADDSKGLPLNAAAKSGHSDALQVLLDHGADIEAKTSAGETALLATAFYGQINAAQVLLEKGADISAADEFGETVFIKASSYGHVALVKLLVERGCYLESHDNLGHTAIHLASSNGHFNVVKYLVEKGACLQPNSDRAATPLYYAASNGHLEVVKILFSQRDLSPNTSTPFEGDSPLHVAARTGHSEIVDFLLLQNSVDPFCRNRADETAIYDAIDSGRLNTVKSLLKKCPNINIWNHSYCSPLERACSKAHVEIVALLLPKVSNLRSNLGPSLKEAARSGSKPVVKMLLDAAARVRLAGVHRENALISAAECGNYDVVTMILEKVQEHRRKKMMEAAFRVAAQFGHGEIVKSLLERGTSSKAADKKGWTALNLASYAGHLDIVKQLIAGCSDNLHLATAADGFIPIHHAAEQGHLEVLQHLLAQYMRKGTTNDGKDLSNVNSESKNCFNKSCSPVNVKSNVGRTLLHCAAVGGRLEVAKYLLDNNADPTILDGSGRSPLILAAWYGHVEIVELLLETPGSNATLLDHAGRSALFFAAVWGHCEVVKTLLALPAIAKQFLKKDAYNSTFISAALRRRNEKAVVQLLDITRPSLDSPDFGGQSLGQWVRLLASNRLKDIFLDSKWDYYSQEERAAGEGDGDMDEEDGDYEKEHDQKGDSGIREREVNCGVCLRTIPKNGPLFQCGVCDQYSFVECEDCFEFGLKCPYHSHDLVFKEDEGVEGWIILEIRAHRTGRPRWY